MWGFFRARRRSAPDDEPGCSADASADADEAPSYSTDVIESVWAESYRLAFGVPRIDYSIFDEHAQVLARVEATLRDSLHHQEYFPRRPKLLPKLLQTLRDDESSRRELVGLILEDPALTGSVLKLANSAFYRLSPEPVESLDRAVVVLGTDGLRRLVATAILQPVFRLPKGFFDGFATLTWDQAQRTAAGAAKCAQVEGDADPFVAQLLGVVGALARLVIFRATLDAYREQPGVLPRAEVFIRAMQRRGAQTAHGIAASWRLSDASLAALDEQTRRTPPGEMSPLGRAVYYGELCGVLAVLHARGVHSAEGAQALLIQQGLARPTVYAMWHAASAPDQ